MRSRFLGRWPAIFVLVVIFLPAWLFGQGEIRGTVTDSLTSEPLAGANVYLVGTAFGCATNLIGEYRIERVPAGTYTLKVSYIGFRPKEIDIQLQDGQTLVVDVALVFTVVEGDMVVITGQAVGQAAAINQQITSNTIINVVSEEKIKELPDANAAEAIGRLPGVSLLRSGGEANKVILRGLEDKFTNITIDGVKIPPTDATRRGVDLSTLSQSSLSGIELYKASTPDQDGDALAGSINLVTKKAPEIRNIRLDLKGNYNHLMKSANQYDFSLRYGERFFNSLLGVQLIGNLEKRNRSSERIDVDYGDNDKQAYFINNFLLEFTDEVRKRDGFSILLDLNTPDDGTIRFNNVYSRTQREYMWSTRDYPSHAGGSQGGNPVYDYRYREQEMNTFSSALRGDNHVLGLDLEWGLSYAQSRSDYPFDYEAIFVEPSGMDASPKIQTDPEQLIDYAVNDFSITSLYWTYYRSQENSDIEKTAFLDISRRYSFGKRISGEFKMGGKYKVKDRSNDRSEDFTPYYLGRWQPYELLPDGTLRPKDFTGTYFEAWQQEGGNFIPIDQFFEEQNSRNIYDSYSLNPLIQVNRLRQWYELNRYGTDPTGHQFEVWTNPLIKYDDYSITERIAAAYIMNTLNLGQRATIIAGLRIEQEDNDYLSMYMPKPVAGFPVPANSIVDTTSSLTHTVFLPNVNVAISPFRFLKLRMAAYKALARPDFNMRLERYIAGRPAEVGTSFEVYVGNPKLKTAEAWNFEFNTSVFSNTIGLISVSAYYKEIKNMYHMLNDFNTVGDTLIERFGIGWASQMKSTPYNLTLPYNSHKPTKVWGFEFEHQINFDFLPGLLRNIVLSYNASIVRSEAYIWGSRIDSTLYDPPGPIPPTWKKFTVLTERKHKLEGMPEFFGNIAMGYDVGGFSARLSLYYQGEHIDTYSATSLSDRNINVFTRLDLALKQKITDNISLLLNVNNLTDVEEGSSISNNVFNRVMFDQSEKYGITIDFGVIAEF